MREVAVEASGGQLKKKEDKSTQRTSSRRLSQRSYRQREL